MNLISLLILPAVISLRDNDGARLTIAAAALVVLIGAVVFSKRKGGSFSSEAAVVVAAQAAHGAPAGASAGE
jgi:K(+)-stimulated pyrophosphate-energized sodium pump